MNPPLLNKDKENIIAAVKQEMAENDNVAAAYIFGSILEPGIFNDIDILILPEKNALNDIFLIYEISANLAEKIHISSDDIDMVLLDLEKTDPLILGEALKKGQLIKNQNPDYLSDKLEEVSSFFLINEAVLYRRQELLREQLEE
ncbi:MAG: nucleotidyltransferase domain-containing protein [Desulfobacterales bacterium]|nr:nucleotidyltransferase domain-containing protein [Desulfobacterales bacterium]